MDTNVNTDVSKNITTMNNVNYDAFISYRHSELDKFVAEELHKQLENFKIPKKIAKKCGKKKISRIFRDKDELPITSNLADPIINALKVSEFLIVICSPRLNESLWCKREIENFIAMHGQDRVLAVLIEGEPSESFPQELLYRDKTITLQNGETQVIKEPVEPLAADVRGKNKSEIKKNIKTEMLRLLAPMLNCNYDDLKQRHRERRMQRIIAVASLVSLVGISFGTISTIMAMEIKEQKEKIDTQYWESLETNAKMASDNALELLESGDRIGAIALARDLLPDSLENQNIPYTPEAFYAMTKSMNPYAVRDTMCPVFQIKEDAEISHMKMSPDGEKIYTITKYGKLTVWDIINKKKCVEISLSQILDYSIYDEGQITFVGNDKVAVIAYEGIHMIDLSDNTDNEITSVIPIQSGHYIYDIYSDNAGKYIVASGQSYICAYDVESEELIYEYDTEDVTSIPSKVQFYGESQIIFCEVDAQDNSDLMKITVVDLLSGEVTNSYQINDGRLAAMEVYEDSLYVAVNQDTEVGTSLFNMVGDATMYSFDLSTYDEKNWEYTAKGIYVNSIVAPYEHSDSFLIESYGKITVLNGMTGEEVTEGDFGSEIVQIVPLSGADTYAVFTRSGSYISFLPTKNYSLEVAGRFEPATDNMKQFFWGNGFQVSLSYASKEVIVYEFYEDMQKEKAVELADYPYKVRTNTEGTYTAILVSNDWVWIIDHKTKSVSNTIPFSENVDELGFTEDGNLQVIIEEKVETYDMNGKMVSSVEFEDTYARIKQLSANGKYVYADDYSDLYIMNCSDGKIVNQVSRETLGIEGSTLYVFSNNADKCVVIDKTNAKMNLYSIGENTLLQSIDINATYVSNILFSEDDTYVYVIYEDGLVEQYLVDGMTLKCSVEGLELETTEIYQKVIDGVTKYYFIGTSGAYVLGDYDGELKVEQYIPKLKFVDTYNQMYWVSNNMYDLYVFPIYTYEEMLGKADQICYDNTLWNNE